MEVHDQGMGDRGEAARAWYVLRSESRSEGEDGGPAITEIYNSADGQVQSQ